MRAESDDLTAGPFCAGGARFVVRTDRPALTHLLTDHLVDLRCHDDERAVTVEFRVREVQVDGRLRWSFQRDGEQCETVIESYVGPYLLWEITRLVMEQHTHGLPMHAAALQLADRAIVVAGPTHAGKSTFAGWLTAHGWSFLTDEVALITASGPDTWVVEPFPRPIGVRYPSPLEPYLAGSAESLVPASRLGQLGKGAALAAVVLLERDPDGPARRETPHPASALREIWDHLPNRAGRGYRGLEELTRLFAEVPVCRLNSADLPEATEELRELVATKQMSPLLTSPADWAAIAGRRQYAAWLVDRFAIYDEGSGVLHELTPSASLVWELSGGASDESVVRAVQERFPEAPREEIESVLRQFTELGIARPTETRAGGCAPA